MKILVTGGGGFLGKAIVKLLLAQNNEVRSFSRQHYADLTQLGIEQFRGDLTDLNAVIEATNGCDCIYHVAAKAGVWGHYNDFYQPNVIGTKNIIEACRTGAISRLVYTSSPSVIFDGSDMEGIDESIPYPDHYLSHYPRTKAEAEQLVIAANDATLATVALRPHLIWGPEDNHLVPRILKRGREGSLRKIGTRPCLVDTVYIDNAAKAHLQVAEKLEVGSTVAGKTYFISNNEPLPLWDIINRILEAGDVAPVTRSIPTAVAYGLGAGLEFVYRRFNLSGEPRMTRFIAKELSTAHWFNLAAAQRDFNYNPEISIETGLERLRNWLSFGS